MINHFKIYYLKNFKNFTNILEENFNNGIMIIIIIKNKKRMDFIKLEDIMLILS